MAAVYNFSTGVPNNTNRDTIQCYRPNNEYATRVWDSNSSEEDYQQTRDEGRISRSRSGARLRGDSRHSSCRSCFRTPCRCRSTERFHGLDRSFACESCGRRSCQCFDDEQRGQSRRRRDKHTDQHALKREIELLEYHKKDKRYDQANEVFLEAMDRGKARPNSDEMLKLKASFADMLVTQGKCHEAEGMVEEILSWNDLPISLERQCNEVIGNTLCSRKRYSEAEKWFRKLYDRNSKDEWSLKMGELMCQAIASQGDYDLAQTEAVKLWESRKKSLGKDHPSTVKSAITAVDHLAKLIQKMPPADGSNRSRTENRRLAYEAEVEHILHDIWSSNAKSTQKQDPSMLKAGHELGMSLLNQGRFNEAERTLDEVWQNRQVKLGKFDKDTMSSGVSLSQAMYMQGPERCREAIKILENIRDAGATQIQCTESPIAEAVEAHLAVAYSRIGEHRKAEALARQSMYKAPARGVATPSHYMLRLALARALMGQGGFKTLEGQEIEAQLHLDGQPQSPIEQKFLANSRMLTDGRLTGARSNPDQLRIGGEASTGYNGSRNDGLPPIGVGGGRSWSELQNLNGTRDRLPQLWDRRTDSAGHDLARARSGAQCVNSLIRLGRLAEARKLWEEVLALKERLQAGRLDYELNRELNRTADLINSLGYSERGGNPVGNTPWSDMSSSLVKAAPRNVSNDDRYPSRTPTRRRRLGFFDVLMS